MNKHEQWAEVILPADGEAGAMEQSTTKKPLIVLAIAVLVCFSVLSLRLFTLQVVHGQRNLGLAEGNRIRQKIIRAPRGIIYDRDRHILVRNVASFDLTAIPRLLPTDAGKRAELYQRIANLSGIKVSEIQAKVEAKGLGEFQPQLVASNLEREKALVIDQTGGDLPGFSLDVNPIREYLDGGVLAQFLGYTGRVNPSELKGKAYQPTDYIGKLGLEKQYESILRGINGSEQTEVDAAGRPVKVMASKPPVSGSNLVLSVDMALQNKLIETIRPQLERSGSKRAAAVALHPKTGEVLAAVSIPNYDNNLFSGGISATDYSRLTQDAAQPLFNKVTSGAYPTGSIIKPLVASAALEEKVVSTSTTVDDQGQLEISHRYDPSIKYVFRSWEPGGLGPVNIYRALALSSNIYFYTIGGGHGPIGGLGIDRLAAYYHKFGLGKPTGIDTADETRGRVPTPDWKKQATGETWYTGDTFNVAVGQGDLLASPLQMAMATAAIANGGQVIQPHFLKEVLSEHGQGTQRAEPKIIANNFISPANLAIVRQGMRQVVTSGTACCLIEQQVKVPVAGKTGSAETDPGKKKPHAWFTAFAPFDDPQIVLVVLIENSGEGSEFAAPVARETLAWYFNR